MNCIVSDSSSLILLTKCSLLKILCELTEIFVPKAVIAEVASQTLVRKHPDAALISALASEGSIHVKRPNASRLKLPISLHKGEKDALLLALQLEGSILATDDGKAIKAAKFLKLPFTITPKIIVDLFRRDKINFEKARESLEKLGVIGRYSPEILADAMLSLREENDDKAHNHKNT